MNATFSTTTTGITCTCCGGQLPSFWNEKRFREDRMKGGRVQTTCHNCRPLKRGHKDRACTAIAREFNVSRAMVSPFFVGEVSHQRLEFFVQLPNGQVLNFFRELSDFDS